MASDMIIRKALPDEVERLLDAEDPDIYAWLADAPVATTSGVVP